MARGDLPADWGFAESLAYASLAEEGTGLRLVGQDSGRGTFFHRHAVLHNQANGETLMPLHGINPAVDIEVIDSLLSEEAAESFLGTQGYSWDTQSDMAWALFGASVALLALGTWHDRQLRGTAGIADPRSNSDR